MTSKDLLLKNKELRLQWAAVAHSDWFMQVLTHARASLLESELIKTSDHMAGAKEFERILKEIADDDSEPVSRVHTGLRHDLDKAEPKHDTQPEKK